MENREELIELYEIYGGLLSKKQIDYFENYFYEDYSLSEISENFQVSRAIVNKTINLVKKKLFQYEKIMKIKEKSNILYDFSNKLSNPLKEELLKIINNS